MMDAPYLVTAYPNMGGGWIDIDGGIAHAVDLADAGLTLCGLPTEKTVSTVSTVSTVWADAPAPRCKRCVKVAADRRR